MNPPVSQSGTFTEKLGRYRFQLGIEGLIAFDLALGLVFYGEPLALALYYAPVVLWILTPTLSRKGRGNRGRP